LADRKRKKGESRWATWLKPLLVVAALSLAAFLLYRTLSRYTPDEIAASLTAIPPARIALAGLFAAASYLCLTLFDWLALRYVGRSLPYGYVALASFTSLSLGHNIGFAALSSGAVRYRFYSRWGLTLGEIAKVILFCGITVGLGLAVLGGCALLLRSQLASEITGLNQGAVLALGVVCLALPLAYLALAAFNRKPLRVRKFVLEMPPLRLALGQIVVGPVNFAFVAACLHQTLAALDDVSYLAVAAVYVIAVVTALVSHVPGGLGVIETVVMFLLPQKEFIGALILFRVIYFFVPLCIGAPLFAVSELVFRQNGRRARRSPAAKAA
jgi:glycosyltransferase 2 family protein